MRYKVLDTYDFYEVLCETDDLNEAYNAAIQRFMDTDGECTVTILDKGIMANFPLENKIEICFDGEEEE